MKKTVLLALVSLLLSSCVVRDNPLDVHSDEYEKPVIEETVGIPETEIVTGDSITITPVSNSENALFRYRLNGGDWSTWSKAPFSASELSSGHYTLEIETSYPSQIDTARETVTFTTLAENNSLYLHSAASAGEEMYSVTLSGYELENAATTMHLSFPGSSIVSVTGSQDSSFIKVLPTDSTIDYLVFPGGVPISGSKSLLQITLIPETDTIDFNAHLEDKLGNTIPLNTTLGTIISQEDM